ncbi:MAG: hypothetical protein K940chlam7_01492 [Chlamydiae bacterium]|nr:hypothetical protein [Chlamydiota bacterium]
MIVKHKVKKFLDDFGLLLPLFRIREYIKSCRSVDRCNEAKSLAFPLPPHYLRMLVSGNTSDKLFLSEGRVRSKHIEALLGKHGINLVDQKSILDFGCGCARVLRHFDGLTACELHGCDYNKKLIDWCTREQPFAEFIQNSLKPPLPYKDNQHTLVYAISVFTHLSEDLQHAWIDEVYRILAPGGHLIFTVHGTSTLHNLTVEEKERFGRHELIVKHPSGAGSNLCSVFHPRPWVEQHLAQRFTILDHISAEEHQDMPQDMVLFKKT